LYFLTTLYVDVKEPALPYIRGDKKNSILIAMTTVAKSNIGLSGTKLSQFAVPKCTENLLQSEGVPLRAGPAQ
jgi:hypothetical protein